MILLALLAALLAALPYGRVSEERGPP